MVLVILIVIIIIFVSSLLIKKRKEATYQRAGKEWEGIVKELSQRK